MIFQADTIVYDQAKIAKYQAKKSYDYFAQLDLPDDTWFNALQRWFYHLLNTIFSGKFEEKYTIPVMIFIFITIAIAVVIFLYIKRPELFMRSKKKISSIPYDIEEENIHSIDFAKEISNALNSKNYKLATRLKYLQTLRLLSDNKLIDWQIHKTPTEYLYEIRNKEMKPPFRELTNHFLQIRYGNYEATSEIYEMMDKLQDDIKTIAKEKGGAK